MAALANEPAVIGLASDLPVLGAMKVSDKAIAADQTRAGTAGSWLLGLGGIAGVSGRNVGVAIIDSGIAAHQALANKVVAAVSFVPGDPSVNDGFGHGTHIAGIIAGTGSVAAKATSEYSGGVAPGAHLVNVRVLAGDDTGYTSSVIAGLDWVIANRAKYRIQVVNMSLGHGITGPCVTDPLCSSVGRGVNAGLIVVVSAGNRGRTASEQPALGTITSPGTSPLALTVGAINTWGTVVRSDDTVTYANTLVTDFRDRRRSGAVGRRCLFRSRDAREPALRRSGTVVALSARPSHVHKLGQRPIHRAADPYARTEANQLVWGDHIFTAEGQ